MNVKTVMEAPAPEPTAHDWPQARRERALRAWISGAPDADAEDLAELALEELVRAGLAERREGCFSLRPTAPREERWRFPGTTWMTLREVLDDKPVELTAALHARVYCNREKT